MPTDPTADRYEQLRAAERQLTWTDTPPTEEGDYLWRSSADRSRYYFRVFKDVAGQWQAADWSNPRGAWSAVAEQGGQWAGPVPRPS